MAGGLAGGGRDGGKGKGREKGGERGKGWGRGKGRDATTCDEVVGSVFFLSSFFITFVCLLSSFLPLLFSLSVSL